MLRRSSPLLAAGMLLAVVACSDLSGLPGGTGTPIGIVLMNARTQGAGYTTYPKVNFYSVGSATFSFSTVNSDTCVTGAYDSTAVAPNSAKQIGGGAFLRTTVSGRTDSLFKAASGDQTYHPTLLSGIPFNPGDSITFEIAGDAAGFPQLTIPSPTSEPFAIVRPVIPPSGQGMNISWTAATDANAAMYIALIYNHGGGSSLNTQIFCDFHDDGQGTVQARLLADLASSAVPFVMHAQRVRTNLVQSATGYFNTISTFEVPTPVSP